MFSLEDKKRKQWEKFIAFCEEMKFGKLEYVAIKNGVPTHAEVVKPSIKFDE